MSGQVMPVTGVRINLARGIVGLIGQAAARIPHGREVWDGGLKDVVAQAIQDIGVPTEELTAVEAARAIGVLKSGKRRRRA
jgi:hypothetical protein